MRRSKRRNSRRRSKRRKKSCRRRTLKSGTCVNECKWICGYGCYNKKGKRKPTKKRKKSCKRRRSMSYRRGGGVPTRMIVDFVQAYPRTVMLVGDRGVNPNAITDLDKELLDIATRHVLPSGNGRPPPLRRSYQLRPGVVVTFRIKGHMLSNTQPHLTYTPFDIHLSPEWEGPNRVWNGRIHTVLTDSGLGGSAGKHSSIWIPFVGVGGRMFNFESENDEEYDSDEDAFGWGYSLSDSKQPSYKMHRSTAVYNAHTSVLRPPSERSAWSKTPEVRARFAAFPEQGSTSHLSITFTPGPRTRTATVARTLPLINKRMAHESSVLW